MPEEVQAPEPPVGSPIDSVVIPDQVAGQAEPQSFMSIPMDNGEDLNFANQDEAIKYVKEGTLRHSDYTRKTQEAAGIRKQAEARAAEIESQMTSFMTVKDRYDKIDAFMKSRPDVKQYITSQMRNPSPGAQNDSLREYADTQTNEIKSELEKFRDEVNAERQARDYETQKEKAFSTMEAKYPDFKRDTILKAMEDIEGYQSLPTDMALSNLAELIYYANKGRGLPAQEKEQKIVEKLSRATKPMNAGVTPTEVSVGEVGGDFDEIAAQLKTGLGIS